MRVRGIRSLLCSALVLIASLILAVPQLHSQSSRPAVTLGPLIASNAVHPGNTLRVALKVTLPEGIHTQSNKPRDPYLIPTTLTFDAPAAITVNEIVWPPSTDFQVAGQGQPLAVFEHEFVVGVQLTVAATAPLGNIPLPVHLRYQACNDQFCFAPTVADSQWAINIAPDSAAVSPENADVFAGIPFGTGEAPTAKAPAPTAAAPGSDATDSGLSSLDRFTVQSTTGGYLGSSTFLDFIKKAESGTAEQGMFEGRGPLAIILIVFLGGLALNLTPCVLPMIPINLAIIGAGAQAGSRGRGFLLGSAYGAAMAVVYGVLGLVVILTAGTFGTINSSPWFNVAIAVLFVVLGLAMFDVLLIDFSKYSARFGPSGDKRGTFVLAFSMGAVAALLAGACVAPVVIQVVLFSSNLYSTGTKVALALPFFLGIGMAVPWPIVGAGLASLPKPGMWMVRVKQALGVVILVTAVYYGYEAYTLFANRWVNPDEVAASVQDMLKEGWTPSLAQGLATAEREHKPVLIDMWATWCKNCLTMDKTTLRDPAVISALSGYVKVKFQADDPDVEPAKSVMKRFNAVGLPTYVILRPK